MDTPGQNGDSITTPHNHIFKKPKLSPPPSISDDENSSSISEVQRRSRRCLHCASEKTPQWRQGPLGPKTLCNACGVRFKSGRLVPEYRPASSPTFVSTKHSNSHRKVLELRRPRDMQLQGPPPAPAPAPAQHLNHAAFISEPEIRKEFAHHQPGTARINNGSFGCCPASVISAQQQWQLKFLQQPDDFYFNHLETSILHSRTLIKDLVNADHVEEISLFDNATAAAAIVLQQISVERGDAVVMLHCAKYEAVKKSIQAYVTRASGSVIEVHLPFPVNSNEDIVEEFRKGLEKGRANGSRVRLAIIDHITSMPSLVLPVAELVKVCREQGVDQVFVDAAHAIGSVRVDVKAIGADYYVSNLHMWLFCPPSVAFLYCRKSNVYGNGLPIESSWIEARDYSAQLVVPSALDFVNRFEGGIEGTMKKNHDAVVKMGEMLAKSWGTNLGSPPDMCASMIMVGLPSSLCILDEGDALNLRSHLRFCHGIEVLIHYQAPKDGEAGPRDKDGLITGYARISHQVYNTVEDYEKFRNAINQLVEDHRTCKMLLQNEKVVSTLLNLESYKILKDIPEKEKKREKLKIRFKMAQKDEHVRKLNR